MILAIESSCDDTSAAVLSGRKVLSNLVSNQEIHKQFGGVMPEMASRAHLEKISIVVNAALEYANCSISNIDYIAYTQGPGLIGSLLVGSNFARALAYAQEKELVPVHHMQAHVLAHFINSGANYHEPELPFLCLTVSGGHTQLVAVNNPLELTVLGSTIDDAAGEAFDKCAKMLGLDYPGGPLIDQFAKKGNPKAFQFSCSKLDEYRFSFSGFKTSVLYFLQKQSKEFIEENKADLCASIQAHIIESLLFQVKKAMKEYRFKGLAIAGGVSANSGLRNAVQELCKQNNWNCYIPKFEYCTDNAAMVGISAYYKIQNQQLKPESYQANPRLPF